jgi:hypothetical protein
MLTPDQPRPNDRGRNDRGTVLLLMPAAVMIMLVLGAIAVDIGLSAVRARELRAVAASSANDSLAALDVTALRTDGQLVLDPATATQIVAEAVARGPLPQATIELVSIGQDPLGRPEITVQLGLEVDLIIAPALPGAPTSIHVSATEHAVIVP